MNKFIHTAAISALLLGSSGLLLAQADFIRQEDLKTGIIMDIPVNGPGEVGEESGSLTSTMEVGADGMLVTLYGRDSFDGEPTALDEVLVSDRPKGSVVITTEDPHIPLASGEDRRTRADRLYFASLSFSEFSNTLEAPKAAKTLYLQRLGIEYPGENNRVVDEEESDYRVISDNAVIASGELKLRDDRDDDGVHTGVFYDGSRTYLTSDVLFAEKGKEKIRILAIISPEGAPEVVTEIASATVRIWPVFHDGIITASDVPLDGKRVTGAPSSIELKGQDLYPKSDTYVVITGPNGTAILDKLIASYDGEEPEDLNVILSSEDWADKVAMDGEYTVEVLTETPFFEGEDKRERLMSATFNLKSTINARASFVSAE